MFKDYGVWKVDWKRNEWKKKHDEKGVLNWFGHMNRMGEERQRRYGVGRGEKNEKGKSEDRVEE